MNIHKTLRQTIEDALCIGPLRGAEERLFHSIRHYLAQHIQAAIYQKDTFTSKEVVELFLSMTEEQPEVES